MTGTLKHSRAWEWLGMRLVDAAGGSATVEMVAREEMANVSGFVHGGLIGTLADSAMGRAVRTIEPEVRRAASFDLKLNFIASARIGEKLRAVGKVVHSGRRTVVTECRVEGERGRLIATASGTFMVSREREEGAD